MRRVFVVSLVVAVVGVLTIAASASAQLVPPAQPAPGAQFVLGFGTLDSLIPGIVGVPLQNEHPDAVGNEVQLTSNGLMVWNKVGNYMTFTNGSMTWVLGPNGLQVRPNDQRFAFEVAPVQLVPGVQPAPGARFVLGFATMANMIPSIVGLPIENEHPDAFGNETQATTNGLLVWHKVGNYMTFTNGSKTWVLGPNGLQVRSNDQLFGFEISAMQMGGQ